MKRLLPAATLLVVTGCAHVEAPTGGMVERRPLQLLEARPADLEVIPSYTGPVVFIFEERLSERLIQEAVHVSPQTSPTHVRHRGRELRVELARGWEPGMVYQVSVSPTIQDLFGNRLAERVEVVFSTGPELTDTRLAGSVLDRITGRPERDARVEAVRLPDSLVYAMPSDTAGAFAFRSLPAGEYEVRAYRDMNRNRRLDPLEPRDVRRVELREGSMPELSLRLVAPDTTPPRLVSARAEERLVEINFDDHLDPDQTLNLGQFAIRAADGAIVEVARVAVGTLPAADAPAAEPESPRLPSRILSIEPARALEPGGRYNVVVRGVRNLAGLAGDAETSVEVPAAAPPPAEGPDAGEDNLTQETQ